MAILDLIDPAASIAAAEFKMDFAALVDKHAGLGLQTLVYLTSAEAMALQALCSLPPRVASETEQS